MNRRMVLAAAVLLCCAACGDDEASESRQETAPPAPVIPAPPPEFWSQPATTEQQRATVAQATRQIDVCALIPRDTLSTLAEIHAVTVGLDSCRAVLGSAAPGEGTTLTWHATLLPDLTPGRGVSKNLGDVQIRLVPDRDDAMPRSCGATAHFPAGAAFYLGLTTPPGQDPCAVADGLLPGMIDRWRAAPPQGTSPDTVATVLLGADPCAVRAKLADTTPSDEQRLTQCLFGYRGEKITVGYEYRVPAYLAANSTEEHLDGRTVHRSASVYDSRIPIYTAAVGPELPAESTAFGRRIPIVEVVASTDDVAKDVMTRVLTLFPQG